MIKKGEQPASTAQVIGVTLLLLCVLPLVAYQSLGVNDSYSVESCPMVAYLDAAAAHRAPVDSTQPRP